MAGLLPELYFRVRDNGALVFRVDTENRQQRIEMDQIAVVNLNKGEVKPQGDSVLSDSESATIADWIERRRAQLAARDLDDILRTVDHLNLTAQWAQSKAGEDELEAVTDALLMSMHDLRAVLVRRRADRLGKR